MTPRAVPSSHRLVSSLHLPLEALSSPKPVPGVPIHPPKHPGSRTPAAEAREEAVSSGAQDAGASGASLWTQRPKARPEASPNRRG